jgi:hypothetical protein
MRTLAAPMTTPALDGVGAYDSLSVSARRQPHISCRSTNFSYCWWSRRSGSGEHTASSRDNHSLE